MDQQHDNRKRKDLRQILKEPKLKHKIDPVFKGYFYAILFIISILMSF
jgi:hypothetical protein